MARDYKHRAQPKAKPKQQARGGPWFLAGLLVGAFAVGLTWLKLGTDAVKDNQWISAKPAAGKTDSHHPAVPPPQFDFYDRLPEMEVVVPDEEIPQVTAPAPRKDGKPAKVTPLLIQVASLKKAADAERLKAQLALLGMQARVTRVKVDDGDTWHRVRIGPFTDRKSLDATRKRLAENGMRGIVIRAAGG
jgi:cell division protein FtsN